MPAAAVLDRDCESLATLVGQWAETIVGVAGVAMFAGKAVADDVKLHGRFNVVYRLRHNDPIGDADSANCVSLISLSETMRIKG